MPRRAMEAGSGTEDGDVSTGWVEPEPMTLNAGWSGVKIWAPGEPGPEYPKLTLKVGARLGLLTFATRSNSPSAGSAESGCRTKVVQSSPPVPMSLKSALDAAGKRMRVIAGRVTAA